MTSVQFRDHELFHRAALHMALAGSVAGLAGHLALGGATAAASIALVAGAAALAGLRERSARNLALVAVLAGLASAALTFLPRYSGTAAIAGFGACIGAAFALGSSGRRLLVAIAAGAVTGALAHQVLRAIATSQELSGLPPWLGAILAGAAFSFVSVVAILPRHIDLVGDRVGNAYRAVRSKATGEVSELVERGHGLWTKVEEELPPTDGNRTTLEDAVLRLFEVAGRWTSVEAGGAQNSAASLVDRMEALDKRIAESDDPIAKEQYQNAKGALAEQLRYLKDIGRSRERVLARMHNYLATMERLRLAVVNLRSADASRDSVQPIVSDLQELGRDIDSSSEAIAEADLATRPVAQA